MGVWKSEHTVVTDAGMDLLASLTGKKELELSRAVAGSDYTDVSELAKLTGLPQGEHKATYVFLSGELPPNGSVPVRYDVAHELRISVGMRSAVIEMGLAAADGVLVRKLVGI